MSALSTAVLAFSLSTDAFAVALCCATCLMVAIGIMAGHQLGRKTGRYAEVLGGIGLWLVGAWILYEHIGA